MLLKTDQPIDENTLREKALTLLLTNQTFNIEEEFKKIKQEEGIEKYTCRKCYQSFKDFDECGEHSLEHNSTFKCTFCHNLLYGMKESLIEHLIEHFREILNNANNKNFKFSKHFKQEKSTLEGLASNLAQTILKPTHEPNKKRKRGRPRKMPGEPKSTKKRKLNPDNQIFHPNVEIHEVKNEPSEFDDFDLPFHEPNIDYTISKGGTGRKNTCLKCNKEYKNRGKLFTHLRKIHPNKKVRYTYQCDVCQKGFNKAHSYLYHKQLHDAAAGPPDESKFPEKIRKNFKLGVDYLIVRSENGDSEKFRCNICDKDLLSKLRVQLWYHMRKKHLKDTLKDCPICYAHFRSEKGYLKHMKMHESKGDKDKPKPMNMFLCAICGESYKTKLIADNCEKKHLGIYNHECTLCPRKFLNKYALKSHILLWHPPPDFDGTCKICGKVCKNSVVLKTHIKEIHLEKRKFECKLCNRVYLTQHSLRNHELTHKGYQCKQCGKVVNSQCSLRDHENTHTGVRNWECPVCNKKFTNKRNLRRHSFTHDNSSRKHAYLCRFCNKTFTQRSSLKTHMRIHTGEKPFPCELCPAAFITKPLLTMHCETVHAIMKIVPLTPLIP